MMGSLSGCIRQMAAMAAALVIACLAPMANAEPENVDFCFNDWPPYSVMKDGTADGITVDILREAARRVGLAATFRELPWKRCLQMVEAGRVDAVMDAARRDEYVQGDASSTVYTNTFWVRADDPLQAFDTADLPGRSVGLVNGYQYGKELDEILAQPEIVKEYSKDDSTNIRKLSFKRVDIIIGDFASTRYFAEMNGLSLRALLPSHSIDRLYPSFNKDKAGLQSRINTALNAMIADGTIDTIYMKKLGISFSDLVKPYAE